MKVNSSTRNVINPGRISFATGQLEVNGVDVTPGLGVTDGDKGDVTVSASGATWTIDNNAVSLAKLADMATASFLGRSTSGVGDPEVLSISAAKTLLAIGIPDVSGLQTALDARAYDDRRLDWRLASEIGLTFKQSNTVTTTFSASGSLPHGLIHLPSTNSVYATYTGGVKKFDADTMTETGSVTVGALVELIYDPASNKLIALANNASAVEVYTLDPATLAAAQVINDTAVGGGISGAIASDGTHLYVVTYTSPTQVRKYALSGWALAASATLTGFDSGHAARYDGTHLYVAGTTGGTTPWLSKVTPSSLAATTSNVSGIGSYPITDDIVSTGDFIWLGLESGTSDNLVRVRKSDLSATLLSSGLARSCWGLHFDGRYIWTVFSGSPGGIARIDPHTSEIASTLFATGFNATNEIVSDGSRLFVTHYLIPGKISRIVPPTMTPRYAGDGSQLTGISGTSITAGTVAEARIDAALSRDAEVAAAYQPLDPDLDDLADGSLSGSKVGSGIAAGNITSGTLPPARLSLTAAELNTAVSDADVVTLNGNIGAATGTSLTGSGTTLTLTGGSAGLNIAGGGTAQDIRMTASASGGGRVRVMGNGQGNSWLSLNRTAAANDMAFQMIPSTISAASPEWNFGVKANNNHFSIYSYDGSSVTDRMAVYPTGGMFLGSTVSDPGASRSSTLGNILRQTTAPSAVTDAAQLYSVDTAGTAEMFVKDEAGNATQISPHAGDAPDFLYDADDPIPHMTKEIQFFAGYVRYTNHTRQARLLEMTNGERESIPAQARRLTVTETFAEHNARLKLTGDKALKVESWDEVQSKAANERDAQIADWTERKKRADKAIADFNKLQSVEEKAAAGMPQPFKEPKPEPYKKQPLPERLRKRGAR